jgi:hypothetical protein
VVVAICAIALAVNIASNIPTSHPLIFQPILIPLIGCSLFFHGRCKGTSSQPQPVCADSKTRHLDRSPKGAAERPPYFAFCRLFLSAQIRAIGDQLLLLKQRYTERIAAGR